MTEPTTAVPLSPHFCADDADVIIRAAGSLDFHVHKLILSLASPVFKDMFTLPQPPSDKPETLPHVDVQESPKTWENILRTIYPSVPNPILDTLDDLRPLLFAARAYEMESVTETHKRALENRAFVKGDPLHLFSIACGCGSEDQATYVARNAELLEISKAFDPSDLKALTFDAYGRLISFLTQRDDEWHRTLRGANIPSHTSCHRTCDGGSISVSLYDKIKEDLRRPYLQAEEVYIKALEYQSDCASPCPTSESPFRHSKIEGFVAQMVKKRKVAYDRFQPAKWFA